MFYGHMERMRNERLENKMIILREVTTSVASEPPQDLKKVNITMEGIWFIIISFNMKVVGGKESSPKNI